jgi:hypothetical protein
MELSGEGRLTPGGHVHGAARLSGEGHLTVGGTVRIAGVITPPREPKTTSLGLKVEKTFEIRQSEPIADSVRQYELRIDGELTWSGMGDDPVDALLR